jgi:hypothetical protein
MGSVFNREDIEVGIVRAEQQIMALLDATPAIQLQGHLFCLWLATCRFIRADGASVAQMTELIDEFCPDEKKQSEVPH